MSRFMDLSATLGEAVDLVIQIDAYRQFMGEGGGPKVSQSSLVLPTTGEIVARFESLTARDHDEKRWALFRDCQRVVNPVQSSLQGAAKTDPILLDLLNRIVSLKSHWAKIERYPHAALHHTVQ